MTREDVGRTRCMLENLEHRRLLHGGGPDGDDGDPYHSTAGLDLELVEEVRDKVRAGIDVTEYLKTDYDPHSIGVPSDNPRLGGPSTPVVGSALVAPPEGDLLLPDMFPWLGPSGNDYFRDTQIDRFSIPGRSLLRFSTAIANAGLGPVELNGGPITEDGTQTVYQTLYTRDGGGNFIPTQNRTAGEFIYHPQHNHLHFEGYAEYRLLTNNNGTPGGPAIRDDGTEVLGEKVGFCLINISTYDASTPGYSQSPGVGIYSNDPNFRDYYDIAPGQFFFESYGCGLRQGISVGRADIYSSGLDSQWIDVTGVPAGTYFLEVTLDAQNAILESDETNNTIQVEVTISDTGSTANGIQQDRFDNINSNDTFETATDLGSLGDRVEASLTLHAAYDTDFFKFTAASSQDIEIDLNVIGAGDPNLFLYDADFNEIDRSTNPFGNESVAASLVAGETYFLEVENYQYLDDLVGNYALIFDGPQPTADVFATGSTTIREGRSTTLTVSRTGPVTTAFDVELEFGGTAEFGVD
ncbi:MAG: lysyl oxidase family protein, partial [Planctomycetota bacterium]